MTKHVYASVDLSCAWHIASQSDHHRALCGAVLDAHGAPGWPRIVHHVTELYGHYPAVCLACSRQRPLTQAEKIHVGTMVKRRDPREPQHVGIVRRILPATTRMPAQAKVEWQNATRRFSGSTHTTSTMRLDRLVLAEEGHDDRR